jgi:hypothetical protein
MEGEFGEMLTGTKKAGKLVLSIGNDCESHGPALFHDTDSFFAIRAATDAAKRTGAIYAGHIPFTTDRVGDMSKAWMPAYLPVKEFYEKSLSFVKSIIDEQERILKLGGRVGENEKLELVIVAGHGGIPREFGPLIKEKLGVKTTCVFPGAEFGMHACDEEHSLLKFLGHLKDEGVDLIHRVAREQGAEQVLRKWPPLFGLSGFWFLGENEKKYGKEFQVLRQYADEKRIRKFLAEGKLHIDENKGREIYEGFVCEALKAIEG